MMYPRQVIRECLFLVLCVPDERALHGIPRTGISITSVSQGFPTYMNPRPVTPSIRNKSLLGFLPLCAVSASLVDLDDFAIIVPFNDLPLLYAELPTLDTIPIPCPTLLDRQRLVEGCGINECRNMRQSSIVLAMLRSWYQMLPEVVEFTEHPLRHLRIAFVFLPNRIVWMCQVESGDFAFAVEPGDVRVEEKRFPRCQ